MLNQFHIAKIPEIYFGPGKINTLAKLIQNYGSKALIITGTNSLKNSGKWDHIEKQLQKEEIEYYQIALNGEPNPDFVDDISKKIREERINVVVAIGGGSVVDAGKAISAMLTQNDSVCNYLEGVGNKTHSGHKIPFIAIPTTSGTGSETTKNAVLSEVGPNGYKKSIRHDNFVPDTAIIDPELLISLPKHITAPCGMDAFTQLLESYVSTGASTFTDSIAYEAIRNIRDSLIPVSTDHSQDIEKRGSMAYASMISGITLANAGLGVVHGFASVIGGYYNIPHGVVCGTLMGPATRKNIEILSKKFPDSIAFSKYARIGKMMVHGCEKDDHMYAFKLADLIDEWIQLLEIPKLSTFGVREADFEKIIRSTGQKNNPVKLDDKDLFEILTKS